MEKAIVKELVQSERPTTKASMETHPVEQEVEHLLANDSNLSSNNIQSETKESVDTQASPDPPPLSGMLSKNKLSFNSPTTVVLVKGRGNSNKNG